MARTPMKTRTIRVSDEDWTNALNAAAARGENLPDELRKLMRRYISISARRRDSLGATDS